jgi:hypothetical protein
MRGAWLALPLLAACAATPPACPPGLEAATVAEAFFGRSVRDRAEVTDAEWDGFLREVVTPAFPDGLTALDGAGQWRGHSGTIARERSKLLMVALPGGTPPEAVARLAPVIAAYRARFGQESVMIATRGACVGF